MDSVTKAEVEMVAVMAVALVVAMVGLQRVAMVVAVALVVAMGWILSSVKRVIAGEYGRLTR